MSRLSPTQQRGGYCLGQVATAAILLLAAGAAQVALGDPLPGIVVAALVVFAFWVVVFLRQGRQ